MTKTRVERINPYLDVHDVSKSVKFYVDVLGFELYFESPELAILEWNGHQIHLSRNQQRGNPHRIWIGVDDIEILFERYQERDVEFLEEPTNYYWAYQMIVADLDSNRLIFGSGPKEDQPFQNS